MAKNKKLILFCSIIAILLVVMLLIFFLTKPKNENITYKVTFDSNGGTNIQEQIIKKGELVQKPNEPTREGYVFIEWRNNGILFDFNTLIEQDITLIAEWTKLNTENEMITIKFDTDGGSTIPNQVIEMNTKATKPNDPTKEGYNFIGWFYGDNEFKFNEKISENIVLTAKWKKIPTMNEDDNDTNDKQTEIKKQYTVTFNSNGGSNISSKKVNEGSKVSKPNDPTRKGYTFAGWMLNDVEYNFNSSVTKNITLVAKWTEVVKNKYTVIFDSNGGSNIASKEVLEGDKVSKPTNPSKKGYNFVGWTLNNSNYDFNAKVTKNITLVAKWTQKSYSVVANRVDNISPARILTVYEDGKPITVQTILYSDETTLCSGSNPNINYYAIEGETTLKLVLTGGNVVTSSLTIN